MPRAWQGWEPLTLPNPGTAFQVTNELYRFSPRG